MGGLIMEEFVLEYYSRKLDYHGIGTFHRLGNEFIKPGDNFIVPSADLLNGTSHANSFSFAGCCEGREYLPLAYKKPLLLTCKGCSETHIISEGGYGAWHKDVCYIENK
jgi:hypothetical protein